MTLAGMKRFDISKSQEQVDLRIYMTLRSFIGSYMSKLSISLFRRRFGNEKTSAVRFRASSPASALLRRPRDVLIQPLSTKILYSRRTAFFWRTSSDLMAAVKNGCLENSEFFVIRPFSQNMRSMRRTWLIVTKSSLLNRPTSWSRSAVRRRLLILRSSLWDSMTS